MVAQLEHQFRLGRLSIQGLWFYCQPMMGPMQALSTVIKKASANNFVGAAVLNLLQSQAKARAGDHVVRSLLERMIQCASFAYLGMLERAAYGASMLYVPKGAGVLYVPKGAGVLYVPKAARVLYVPYCYD
ncbi:unnamed protein product [Ilex paraguariensis]|uniref:Gamma-tubulin complex component n=1 Tax=Ilex paraguariensis TaxID=185542 RepID=A0ABC8RQC2_9AQUA